MKVAITKEEISMHIEGHLLLSYSSKDREAMRESLDSIDAWAPKIYESIQAEDKKLSGELAAFTPYKPCRLSLIRDVLVTQLHQRSGTIRRVVAV